MQATFASAEVRAKSLAEMHQADAAEAEKLLQRQQAAEAQYDQGLSKLRATARQLQSLASRVSLSHGLHGLRCDGMRGHEASTGHAAVHPRSNWAAMTQGHI